MRVTGFVVQLDRVLRRVNGFIHRFSGGFLSWASHRRPGNTPELLLNQDRGPHRWGSERSSVRVAPSGIAVVSHRGFSWQLQRLAERIIRCRNRRGRSWSNGEQSGIRHREKAEISTVRRTHSQVPAFSYARNTAKCQCRAGARGWCSTPAIRIQCAFRPGYPTG